MPYMYGTCCVPFLFRKPLVKNTFFKSFPRETFRLWISKIRISIWCEESTRSVDFMDSWSVFGFVQKNAKSVFGFRNWRIWIFPKKRTQCRINLAKEWCAKNRCCESSLVTSPLTTTTRRQRERKKNNRVYWAKPKRLHVHHAFVHICYCTTRTWKCLILRFMEDVKVMLHGRICNDDF